MSRVSELILDAAPSTDDYPREYEVVVMANGEWSKALAKGSGNGPVTVIGLPLVEAHRARSLNRTRRSWNGSRQPGFLRTARSISATRAAVQDQCKLLLEGELGGFPIGTSS